MEGRGRKRTIETSAANPNKHAGIQALRNFTIPRKKRLSGQVLLEPCPEESREYTLIQSKLKESRLDMRKEHANDWLWKDVKLVHNEVFLKEFSEKRSDMRARGRHGREMEECYCFLVESYEATSQIYQSGLRTGSQDQCCLGKPSHGVYLFKHVDVALKHATSHTLSGKNLIVFKVLFGKVKKVTPSTEWNKTVDPMVGFDCHMAKDAGSHRDGLYQQTLSSSVYLFDYNERQELNQRPRQCMPYAVVSFSSGLSPSISLTKLPAGLMKGHLERLKGCTVAKRRGKGENATVTFKRFPTSGCPGHEYRSQASRVDATPPFQHNDLQSPVRLIPQQLYSPIFPTAEHFGSSTPCGGVSGIPWHSYTDEAACLSDVQEPSTTSSCGNNTDTLGVKPETATGKISTIVYSSRLVKDPRLSRPEMTKDNKSSSPEITSSVLEPAEQGGQMQSENQEMKDETCEKPSARVGGALRENGSAPFSNETHESDPTAEETTENVPSYKFLKIEFQKHAGHKSIPFLEKLTSEQKQTLTDHVRSREISDQINKRGLDIQMDNSFPWPHTESPNNEMYLSTQQRSPLLIHGDYFEVNQSHTRHLVNSGVSNLTSTTDLEDIKRNKVCMLNSQSEKIRQNGTEFRENNVEETEPSPDSQIEHYTKAEDGDTIQAVADLGVSEKSSEPGFFQIDLSENSKSTDCKPDSEPTLSHTIDLCSEFQEHNFAAMDVANCVDISVSEVMESSDRKDQNGQRGAGNHDGQELVQSRPDNSSEMAIEVKRGEAQHNTFYYSLYKRLQLDQLLPNSNGVNLFSSKSYLTPIDRVTAADNHVNETEDLQLIVKIQSSQTPATTERPTLSERFSKLRGQNERLTAFIHMKKLANSCAAHLGGDVKRDSEALIASSGGVKRPRSNNAKLVRLMAQRYSADRPPANGKRLRQKRSKLLGKSKSGSSVVCKISSGQLLIKVLRRAVNFRNRYLLREKKNSKRYLASKRSSCGRGAFSKVNAESSNSVSSSETNTIVDKGLHSDATSPSEPQSHNKALNSQEENDSRVLTDDTSCINAADDDGLGHVSQSKEGYVYPAKQTTEIACDYISKCPSQSDLKITNRNIKLPDISYPVQLDRMETDVETNLGHQEKLSPIRCFDNNETDGDDESAREEQEEEKDLSKRQSKAKLQSKRKDSCEGKEVIKDYNSGACEDKLNSNQAVSSFSSDKTSGNAIVIGQTAVTPDVPSVMNNEMGSDTETGILGDSDAGNLSSNAVKSVVEIKAGISEPVKSKEEEASVNIQKSDLRSDAKCTDANDKDLLSIEQEPNPGTIVLKTLKGDLNDSTACPTENMKHLSEPTSDSRCQPALEGTQSSWTISTQVGTRAGFDAGVINDAKLEALAVIKDDLHLAWQGQGQNNFPSTSETHIISKLRDYLTKFEFSVKKQESINDSDKERPVPMAWITLDSTVHKRLLDIRHYNKPALADPRLQDTTHFPTAPAKHKQRDERGQLPSRAAKRRRRRSKADAESPDITLKETIQKELHAKPLARKDTQKLQIPSGVCNINSWLQNHGNALQQHGISSYQGSGNARVSSGEHVKRSLVEKTTKANEQTLHNEMENKTAYSVVDISSALKLADHAVSLTDLHALQLKCRAMLEYFISAFEKDQNISFKHSCISRELILEKYLDQPPPPVEVKFEAINSFLELQMMMEACHFVENKISFLRRKPRFRTLLWYDPSLYGELYKGTVGFQQQSSLFSAFQQYLVGEDYSKLQEYYGAVSTLHQQLQDAPDTSYYMYLKTKRERLEVEAALRNPVDVKSFFLSVPVAGTMNFGDTLESLEKVQNTVTRFTETPADKLPGIFDVGKAEHLSIICRYLHEKTLFLKFHKQSSKVSWFGLEHLLYDASKILVWNESMHGKSNEVLNDYKRSNPQIVYGVTETGVALFKKMDQAKETGKVTQSQQMDAIRPSQPAIAIERSHTALNIQSDDGKKETHEPANKRPACPPPRLNFSDGAVTPLIQASLPVPLGNLNPYTDFPHSSNPWRMPINQIWDWTPQHSSTPNNEIKPLLLSKRRITIPHTEPRTMSVIEQQGSHAIRQPRPPLIVKPRPVGKINHQPTIGGSHADLPKEQARSIIKPLPIQSFPLDTSVIPPPLPPLPYSNTSHTVPLHNNPTPISYPFFLFNGQTYSIGPSLPVPSLRSETPYHPHPV